MCFEKWATATAEASAMMTRKTNQKSLGQALEWAKKTHCATLSSPALKKHAQRKPGVKPQQPGRPPCLPAEEEAKIVHHIKLFRAMKLPTRKDIMLPIINGILQGTSLAHKFRNKAATKYWWYSFLKRHDNEIGVKNQRKHELQRERWTTSEHMEQFYSVLEDQLLALGIAVPNPEYDKDKVFEKRDPENWKCEKIIIVKPL